MRVFERSLRLVGLVAMSALISGVTHAEPPQGTSRPAPSPPPPVPTRSVISTRVVGTNTLNSKPLVAAPTKPSFPAAPGTALAPNPLKPLPLMWDAEIKEYQAKVGDTNANFVFNLTNSTSEEIVITQVRTSCGCTVASVPATPWKLAPGASGEIGVTVDLRGKRGLLAKTVSVYSTAYAGKSLTVKVNIPEPAAGPMGDRSRNLQIAAADRQAIFRGDCASCHAAPTTGKKGPELFAAACGICHEAEHRASMVPDLKQLNHSTDHTYWKVWTAQGKVGTLMPGFSKSLGGPLTDEQIESLANFLAENIPSRPTATPVATGAK